jgi:hypothetical protein
MEPNQRKLFSTLHLQLGAGLAVLALSAAAGAANLLPKYVGEEKGTSTQAWLRSQVVDTVTKKTLLVTGCMPTDSHDEIKAEARKLHTLHETHELEIVQARCLVSYFNGQQRLAYQVNIKGGKLVGHSGKPFDTEQLRKAAATNTGTLSKMLVDKAEERSGALKGKIPAIWAMDDKGNFYVKVITAIGVVHHSSFMAGGPVLSAGEVIIENGDLLLINNESGHYQPSKESLDEAVKKLKAAGLNVDKTQVEYFGAGMSEAQREAALRYDYYAYQRRKAALAKDARLAAPERVALYKEVQAWVDEHFGKLAAPSGGYTVVGESPTINGMTEEQINNEISTLEKDNLATFWDELKKAVDAAG